MLTRISRLLLEGLREPISVTDCTNRVPGDDKPILRLVGLSPETLATSDVKRLENLNLSSNYCNYALPEEYMQT